MPERSDNRQVGAGSGLAASLCNARALVGRGGSAPPTAAARDSLAAPCAMDRASGSPPASPTGLAPAPLPATASAPAPASAHAPAPHHQTGFGAFCSAISDTITVGTRARHHRPPTQNHFSSQPPTEPHFGADSRYPLPINSR